MAQSFFIWNGIDCRSKGIILRGPAAIVRAEERVKHVEIPGRAGDLTETEGADIFNSYIQTVTISVRGGMNVRNVYKWLRGSGFVTFSGEPDRKQAARIIGAITLNRISRNMDHWLGEVQFYCQPFKQLMDEKITSTSTVRNNGDVACKPKIKVTCTGDGQGGRASAVITIGGKTFTVTDNLAGTILMIDSDAMVVTNSDGTADWTSYSSGEFPVLQPGNNTITGSGWSSIEIEKRERYL